MKIMYFGAKKASSCSPFSPINPQDYINYNFKAGKMFPSHENYPSPWAVCEYFAEVVGNTPTKTTTTTNTNTDSGSDGEERSPYQRAIELLETYLKGLFIGKISLKSKTINLKKDIIKQVFLELFPKPGCKSDGNFKLQVLEYGGKDVAIECPEALFAPSAHFSNWPKDFNSDEKAMKEDVDNSFEALSPGDKDLFYDYLRYLIYQADDNPPYKKAIEEILKKAGKPTTALQDAPQGIVQAGNICGVPIYTLPTISLQGASNLQGASFSPGSIKLNLAGQSITILQDACLGRDGRYYVIEDSVKDLIQGGSRSLPGGLVISIRNILKPITSFEVWSYGMKYKDATLYVQDRDGRALTLPIRLVGWREVFVEKIAQIDGRLPDSAVRSVFRQGTVGNVKYGFAETNFGGGTYGILDGKFKHTYTGNQISQINNPVLAIWPGGKVDGWKPYFVYTNIPVKFIYQTTNFISLVPSNTGILVKKLDKDQIERSEPLVIMDATGRELGGFNFANQFPQLALQRIAPTTATLGIDFGTSSSVVALNGNSLSFQISPSFVFGNAEQVSLLDFPISPPLPPVVEVPTMLYLKNFPFNPFSSFEEVSIVFFNQSVLKSLGGNASLRLRRNIKWNGTPDEKKAYLYTLLLPALWSIFSSPQYNGVSLRFSYPLSFSQGQIRGFRNVINDVVRQLGADIPGLTINVEGFIGESEILSFITPDDKGDDGKKGKTLVIDLGGGSTEITYFDFSAGRVSDYVDSIKIAGNNLVSQLATHTNSKFVNVEAGIRAGQVPPIPSNRVQAFANYFIAFLNILINYIRRQISANNKTGPCDKVEIDRVILLGNGWSLVDLITNIPNFPVTAFFNIITSSLGSNPTITKIPNPKTVLAQTLSGLANTFLIHPNKLGSSPSGIKAFVGITLQVSNQKVSWNEFLPFQLQSFLGRTPQGGFVFPQLASPSNQDCNEFVDIFGQFTTPGNANRVLSMRIADYYQVTGSIKTPGKNLPMLVRSPLAVIIEDVLK